MKVSLFCRRKQIADRSKFKVSRFSACLRIALCRQKQQYAVREDSGLYWRVKIVSLLCFLKPSGRLCKERKNYEQYTNSAIEQYYEQQA